MPERMTVADGRLEVGQVMRITSDSGKSVDRIDMPLSPTTVLSIKTPLNNEERAGGSAVCRLSDSDLNFPEMTWEMGAGRLRDLIMALTEIYNQVR